MSKVATYLWFNTQAEEAAEFYTATIPNSKITDVARTSDGSTMVVTFELDGQQFIALNGGPEFTFTSAISIYVTCDSQAEVDDLWATLTEGGEEGPCGWLTDRYGLSWQVIPKDLPSLLTDPDPEKAKRAQLKMQTMKKIDIAGVRAAADAA
jgi:predicted 3-demethylubiquinone-9 3-methyltransferase (glyoxalase superfamily)